MIALVFLGVITIFFLILLSMVPGRNRVDKLDEDVKEFDLIFINSGTSPFEFVSGHYYHVMIVVKILNQLYCHDLTYTPKIQTRLVPIEKLLGKDHRIMRINRSPEKVIFPKGLKASDYDRWKSIIREFVSPETDSKEMNCVKYILEVLKVNGVASDDNSSNPTNWLEGGLKCINGYSYDHSHPRNE